MELVAQPKVEAKKQTCVTKFFQRLDGKPNFEYLFEKEAAERKAKIDEEKRKFKELVKAEKQRIRDEEKRGIERAQQQRDNDSEKRQKEKEAKYTGVHITDGIYLGSRMSAQNYEWLKENEIEFIVNATSEMACYHEKDPSIKYLRISVNDTPDTDISKHFEESCNFIDAAVQESKKVFIHCREGKSRSVTLILAYLMIGKQWTLRDAFRHVTTTAPWELNVNFGFKQHLMNLELKLQGKEEMTLNFFQKEARSSTKGVSYKDLEDEKEKPKRTRKKKGEAEEKTKQMLTFEAYWRILAGEREAGKLQQQAEKALVNEKETGSASNEGRTNETDDAEVVVSMSVEGASEVAKETVIDNGDVLAIGEKEAKSATVSEEKTKRKLENIGDIALVESTRPGKKVKVHTNDEVPISAPMKKESEVEPARSEGMEILDESVVDHDRPLSQELPKQSKTKMSNKLPTASPSSPKTKKKRKKEIVQSGKSSITSFFQVNKKT